jgi:hypothetical protein
LTLIVFKDSITFLITVHWTVVVLCKKCLWSEWWTWCLYLSQIPNHIFFVSFYNLSVAISCFPLVCRLYEEVFTR